MLVVVVNISLIGTFSLQRNQRSRSVCADNFSFIIIIIILVIIITTIIIIITFSNEGSTLQRNKDKSLALPQITVRS